MSVEWWAIISDVDETFIYFRSLSVSKDSNSTHLTFEKIMMTSHRKSNYRTVSTNATNVQLVKRNVRQPKACYQPYQDSEADVQVRVTDIQVKSRLRMRDPSQSLGNFLMEYNDGNRTGVWIASLNCFCLAGNWKAEVADLCKNSQLVSLQEALQPWQLNLPSFLVENICLF